MLPPAKAQVIKDVKTEPKSPGRNPNINTTITLKIDLPVNKLYCPYMSCEVFDNLCKGLVQPKIGSFTINIGEIMFQ